jgi:hypothetical protein
VISMHAGVARVQHENAEQCRPPEQQHLLKTAICKSSFRSILCNVGVHLDFASNAAFLGFKLAVQPEIWPKINIYPSRYNP